MHENVIFEEELFLILLKLINGVYEEIFLFIFGIIMKNNICADTNDANIIHPEY